MDTKEITQPAQLERYSFLWSEVRLLVASLALLLGGVPPAMLFIPIPQLYGLIYALLIVAWVISGVASGYLLYRWQANKQMLFGSKDSMDMYAFLVSVVSGLNLGLAGLTGKNIGMSISHNHFIFVVVAVVYVAAAARLYQSWQSKGEKLF